MTMQLDAPAAPARDRTDRYLVTVDEYRRFRRDGFVIIRQLVSPEEIAELRQHTEDLMQGRLPEQQTVMADRDTARDGGVTVQGLEKPPEHLSPDEKAQYFLRLHMLHRKLALHEKYMLHPRVLDALEVLIGPDVLALQTMLFLKPPGKPGQGWHQDSYYIPTHPDTLCGAWIAIDDVDELNGAMWFAKGSGHEPIYPPCPEVSYGFGDDMISDIKYVKNVSDPDDTINALTPVADRYDQVLASMKAGDVAFFNGHVLHRSKKNFSSDRYRRSFVSHYCNARSYTQWGAEKPDEKYAVVTAKDGVGSASVGKERLNAQKPPRAHNHDPLSLGDCANGSHILARGDTHLPFARPKFGTPCAALLPDQERRRHSQYAARMIASMNNGLLGCAIADPNLVDDDDHDDPKPAGGY
jgi:ectoine hydroxylase-related dioxygenase (phytanoyl-CoA dioxygenase family)